MTSKKPLRYFNWRRRLDEVFVKINGETRHFRRAVDHEGEVLEGGVALEAVSEQIAAPIFTEDTVPVNRRKRESSDIKES